MEDYNLTDNNYNYDYNYNYYNYNYNYYNLTGHKAEKSSHPN